MQFCNWRFQSHIHDGFFNFGVSGNSHVIIAAPHFNFLFTITKLVGVRKVFGISSHLFENPITVILFLFHNLLQEEVLVLEAVLCE